MTIEFESILGKEKTLKKWTNWITIVRLGCSSKVFLDTLSKVKGLIFIKAKKDTNIIIFYEKTGQAKKVPFT